MSLVVAQVGIPMMGIPLTVMLLFQLKNVEGIPLMLVLWPWCAFFVWLVVALCWQFQLQCQAWGRISCLLALLIVVHTRDSMPLHTHLTPPYSNALVMLHEWCGLILYRWSGCPAWEEIFSCWCFCCGVAHEQGELFILWRYCSCSVREELSLCWCFGSGVVHG